MNRSRTGISSPSPGPPARTAGRRDQVIYYQYKAGRARRTLRGIDEQVRKAEQAVTGKAPVKRNRFIQLSGGTRAVNRELEARTDGPVGSRQCTARSKRTGQQCRRPPIVGGTTCWQHGGAARQVQRKAAERVARAQALEVFSRYSPDGDEPADVVAALNRLVHRTEHFERYMAHRVEVLAAREQTAGDPGQLHIELALYRQAIGEARKLLVAVAHLGLDAQVAQAAGRLEQARAERIVAGFEAVLGMLGLDERQQKIAPRAMASFLLWLTSEDRDG